MSDSILQEAEQLINGPRAATYGDAGDSFRNIAERWTVELGETLTEPLTAFDVAHLMVQLKLSRAKNGFHRDSYVDIAGYAGLTEKLTPTAKLGLRTPRVWESVADIPEGVAALGNCHKFQWRTKDGIREFRQAPSGKWTRAYGSVSADDRAHGPFTEVLA